MKTTIIFYGSSFPEGLSPLTGHNTWIATDPEENEWPLVRSRALTFVCADVAAMVAPPEMGENSGVMARDVIQEIPAPPASNVLLNAPFQGGQNVANNNNTERLSVNQEEQPNGPIVISNQNFTPINSPGKVLIIQTSKRLRVIRTSNL